MAHHKYHHDEEEDLGPSKSAMKRASKALQDLGAELAELGKERLAKVPIDEDLRDAVKDYQRFTAHEAKRRQLQYIGRLMRNVDPEPIRAALDACLVGETPTIAFRPERYRDLPDPFPAWRRAEAA